MGTLDERVQALETLLSAAAGTTPYNSQYTGPQIDDAVSRALPGGDIDASIRKNPNPNLLDNWYFGNPVDQRGGYVVPPGVNYYVPGEGAPTGQTTKYYTVLQYDGSSALIRIDDTAYAVLFSDCVRGYTGAGYGIDRWKFFDPGATLLIVDGGVRIIRPQSNVAWGTVFENYKRFAGKQVTLSFLFDKGLYSKSFMIPEVKPQGEFYPDYANAGTEIGHICIGTWDALDGIAVFFNSDGATVSDVTPLAAKLELGTQQTLAHQDADGNWVLNEIPNYADTLARCQMDLIPIAQYDRCRASYILPDSIDFVVPVTNTMRTLPVLIGDGLGVYTITGEKIAGFTFAAVLKGTGDIMVRAVKANHGLPDAVLYAENTVLLSAEQ